jgi:hypothetical protein
MKDFISIETPYSSEEYKIMKTVTSKDQETLHEGFEKSKFIKSNNNGKFLWNIHFTELESLYTRLEELHKSTKNDDYESFLEEIKNLAAPLAEEIELSNLNESEVRKMIQKEMEEIQNENSSDSLRNQNGENLKPETLTNEETLEEDSIMKRKQAGQREKDGPLGQHAPHSQKAKK